VRAAAAGGGGGKHKNVSMKFSHTGYYSLFFPSLYCFAAAVAADAKYLSIALLTTTQFSRRHAIWNK
jgi:hypothetical protein